MRLRTLIVLVISLGLAIGAWALHILYLDKIVEFRLVSTNIVIATPLTVVVIALLFFSVVVILGWKLVSLILFFPYHAKNWKIRRAERRQSRLLADGLQAIVLGLKDSQHKNFVTAADAGVAPVVTYYLAAAVAKDDKRQAALLRKAAKADGDPMVQAMATAQTRLKDNMPAEAAEVLRIAGAATHKATQPLRLLLEACEKSGDIRSALDVAQQLLERDPSPSLRHRIGELTSALLENARNPEAVRGLLGAVNKHGSSPSAISVAAARRLAAVNDHPGASAILAQTFKQAPDPDVLEAIANIGNQELVRHTLSQADAMLSEQPKNTELMRSFADLAIREKLWGQARKLLEDALTIKEERNTYLRLARLAEAEGKSADETNRLYRLAAQAA